jgi:ornithine racemase
VQFRWHSLDRVVKGAGGRPEVARAMARGGCSQLGQQPSGTAGKACGNHGIDLPLMLLRVPGPSELARTVRLADLSLHSDAAVLRLPADEADSAGRRHGVVLMQDLGDLREGWFDQAALIAAALEVERSMPSLAASWGGHQSGLLWLDPGYAGQSGTTG